MQLAGRRALVTGGAGRIGTAIGATFMREGAAVALCDDDRERLERVVASLTTSGGELVALAGDTSIPDDVARIVAEAEAALGPIDLLVTCAAVYPNAPVLEMDVAAWDRVYAVNVRGVMLMSQALARRWIERQTRAAIVNVSSGAARSARRGAAAYCGSKAALEMLTQVLALELGPAGIRVNAVAPGLVMDDVVGKISPDRPDYFNEMLRGTPLGRTGAAQEIAEAVVFLASNRSSWTTGAVLDVSGGSHCGRSHLDFSPRL